MSAAIQSFGKGAMRVAKNYTKGYSDTQVSIPVDFLLSVLFSSVLSRLESRKVDGAVEGEERKEGREGGSTPPASCALRRPTALLLLLCLEMIEALLLTGWFLAG
jgi:hypothetical protein